MFSSRAGSAQDLVFRKVRFSQPNHRRPSPVRYDPEEWAFLRKYSPYHNLSADADYPPFLSTTRTHDDRVHPGHARRMAARMQAMGHDVLFHEVGTGGHSGRESLDDIIADDALEMTFHLSRLGSPKPLRSQDETHP